MLIQWIQKFNQQIIQRRLPLGMFSWRFLLPKQHEQVRFHRDLVMYNFPQLPYFLRLIVVIAIGMRWMFIYSPYYSFRAVKRQAPEITQQTGLGRWQQLIKVLTLSMGHGVPPYVWYRFRLYEPKSTGREWDVIHEHELSSFHHFHNQGRPNFQRHQVLLADKWDLEKFLLEHGVPTSSSLQLVSQGDNNFEATLKRLAPKGKLFCKRRTGNQGLGAFTINLIENKLMVEPLGKKVLPSHESSAYLQQQICTADYLIQPEYQHHSLLNSLNLMQPAITLRLISRCEQSTIHLDAAYLEWPVSDEAEEIITSHFPIAVDVKAGFLQQYDLSNPWISSLSTEQHQALDKLINRFESLHLPHWEEAAKLVEQAHPHLSGIYRIAWDFILTDDHAVLLEGNTGWRVSVPQMICQSFALVSIQVRN